MVNSRSTGAVEDVNGRGVAAVTWQLNMGTYVEFGNDLKLIPKELNLRTYDE
ncbi:hypothetical protein DPMN_190945 [Dreissena polymorpha]|uniref:Uncharacterized protein n=1 Tax=Dreissena polymorpha TaxID=45954 RepID=A0A9D4BEB9_DREPO|nr:hypothetical protein DPMN_190945 [Dreissena polymorpha]